jgi:glycosyltransferase involved in cell wall biosynthesis
VKILIELRPALDGHAGIPQETRLLFRGLARLPELQVEGLLQSSNRVLAKGLPEAALAADRRLDRLSRVVVSLHQGGDVGRIERLAATLRLASAPLRIALRTLLGLREPLTRFEPEHFADFVWRALFARTLPPEDFDTVTRAGYRVLRMPWSALHAAGLATRRFGRALYPRLDTRGFDLMIAETPYPGRVPGGTRLVVRYHDAIPVLMPHTISDKAYHQASHFEALRRNVRDGAWFSCVSEATRRDLLAIFPEAEARAVTIPNMISHHYAPTDEPPKRVPEILRLRRHAKPAAPAWAAGGGVSPYLLMVSTIEPRKNHLNLLAAWELLRAGAWPRLQLVLVGAAGWDSHAILRKLEPWVMRGGLHLLEDVPAPELRLLYRHAAATVCPSFGEGFDYSGVEAMRCGGAVAASDIPVHREVYADAAEFFSPYAPEAIARAIERVIAPAAEARREELVRRGAAVSARYLPDAVLPQWQAFFQRLQESPRA